MSGRRTDLNRLRKIYPYIRRKPVYGQVGSGAGGGGQLTDFLEIETAEIPWSGASTITHTFTTTFTDIPKVVAISKNDNINVYIEEVTLTSVTISASATSNEFVYIHAINVL